MVMGGIFILVGCLLLLQQLDVFYVGSVWHFWPFIIVAVGVTKIVNAAHPMETGAGIWLIFLGLWLFVSIQHVYGLSFQDTWPAMIIALGCSMIWKSYFGKSYRRIREESWK
jgi:hypothetical protein